jgi:glycine cleavage system H protein
MKDLRYTASHEWVDIELEEMAIGITKHAEDLLGDMVFVEMPNIGRAVVAGEEIGVLESVKAASDFYAPVSGLIVDINQEAVNNPAIINQDPYGKGWLVKIRANSREKLVEEINSLYREDKYLTELTEGL